MASKYEWPAVADIIYRCFLGKLIAWQRCAGDTKTVLLQRCVDLVRLIDRRWAAWQAQVSSWILKIVECEWVKVDRAITEEIIKVQWYHRNCRTTPPPPFNHFIGRTKRTAPWMGSGRLLKNFHSSRVYSAATITESRVITSPPRDI